MFEKVEGVFLCFSCIFYNRYFAIKLQHNEENNTIDMIKYGYVSIVTLIVIKFTKYSPLCNKKFTNAV